MALADTLSVKIKAKISGELARAMGTGGHTGTDILDHEKVQSFADGAGANQATGWFSTKGTVTQASAITLSLGDEADPSGGMGDDVPTSDPDELKLRAIMIENLDDTNYIELKPGSNALADWVTGTSPVIRIPAGGVLLATFPEGLTAMTDGTDDELTLQANVADCLVKFSYLFG